MSVITGDVLLIAVFLCCVQTCNKQSKTFAALKQVRFMTEDDLDDYSVEINILSECHHKNIVGLLESFLYDSKLWVKTSVCYLAAYTTDILLYSIYRLLT